MLFFDTMYLIAACAAYIYLITPPGAASRLGSALAQSASTLLSLLQSHRDVDHSFD